MAFINLIHFTFTFNMWNVLIIGETLYLIMLLSSLSITPHKSSYISAIRFKKKNTHYITLKLKFTAPKLFCEQIIHALPWGHCMHFLFRVRNRISPLLHSRNMCRQLFQDTEPLMRFSLISLLPPAVRVN